MLPQYKQVSQCTTVLLLFSALHVTAIYTAWRSDHLDPGWLRWFIIFIHTAEILVPAMHMCILIAKIRANGSEDPESDSGQALSDWLNYIRSDLTKRARKALEFAQLCITYQQIYLAKPRRNLIWTQDKSGTIFCAAIVLYLVLNFAIIVHDSATFRKEVRDPAQCELRDHEIWSCELCFQEQSDVNIAQSTHYPTRTSSDKTVIANPVKIITLSLVLCVGILTLSRPCVNLEEISELRTDIVFIGFQHAYFMYPRVFAFLFGKEDDKGPKVQFLERWSPYGFGVSLVCVGLFLAYAGVVIPPWTSWSCAPRVSRLIQTLSSMETVLLLFGGAANVHQAFCEHGILCSRGGMKHSWRCARCGEEPVSVVTPSGEKGSMTFATIVGSEKAIRSEGDDMTGQF